MLLEGKRLLFVMKGDVGLERPRCILGGVRNLSRIVFLQTGTQVRSNSNIVALDVLQAPEDVDVRHARLPGLPSRSSRAAEPAFALRASARQPGSLRERR